MFPRFETRIEPQQPATVPFRRTAGACFSNMAICIILSIGLPLVARSQTRLQSSGQAVKEAPSRAVASYDELVARARSLVRDNPQEAVRLSEQAVGLDDKRWEGYVLAAVGYSAQHLYDDTISMLQMALGRAPEEKKQAIRQAIAEARRQISPQAASAVGAIAPTPPVPATVPPAALTQAEVVLWKSIENSNRVEDYRGYLVSYPNGTYAGLANSRIEALVWKGIESTQNQDDLRTYLQTYSNGPHTLAATNLLQSLRWTAIEKSTNAADFRAFIQEFPNSTYAGMASNRLEELDWLAVSQSKDPDDFKAYINTHPNGQYLSAAQKMYTELFNQESEKKKQDEEAKAMEEERMRTGWDFKWVHRHLRPTWAYGIPAPVYDRGTMTVSPQGVKWEEDEVKPGTSHNFTATCSDIRFTQGTADNEESIVIYIKGEKMTFAGNDGAGQFLKGFSHFCQHGLASSQTPESPTGPVVDGTTYTYNKGSFTALGQGRWQERAADGAYAFQEQGADSVWIYLRDDSRNISIRIPVGGGWCAYQYGSLRRDGAWNNLYSVTLSEQGSERQIANERKTTPPPVLGAVIGSRADRGNTTPPSVSGFLVGSEWQGRMTRTNEHKQEVEWALSLKLDDSTSCELVASQPKVATVLYSHVPPIYSKECTWKTAGTVLYLTVTMQQFSHRDQPYTLTVDGTDMRGTGSLGGGEYSVSLRRASLSM